MWTVVEAKAKFSELVETARAEGPQTITRNGQAAVIVVSVEDWERKRNRKGTLAAFFLSSPLAGSGVQIERVQDEPRDIDL